MNSQEHLSFIEAAEYCNTSRSKIWRATQKGELLSEKRDRNGRDVWTVRVDDLARWSEKEGLTVQVSTRGEQSSAHLNSPERSRTFERSESERSTAQSAEFQERLLDRFEQTQRRAIVLEMQLQQTQRLLCERNDDQHEREARIIEAEAKARLAAEEAETARREAAQTKLELESLKTEMSTRESQWSEQRRPWYKKIFSKSS